MNLRIDWCSYEAAKYACENWHYSKCIPSSMQKRVAIGIWENEEYVGAIIFGHGANPSIGKPYGLTIYEVCELTRVALKNSHMYPVSKYLSIAIKFLKKRNPGIRLIVSYADTGQGHHGGIYQATNWIYEGVSKGVASIIFKGKSWHMKALRTSYPGIDIKKLRKTAPSDKHKYLMPLDEEMRYKVSKLSKPYPKRAGSIANDVPAHQAGEGGATPTPALQLKSSENEAIADP
jgi:hypothetical protein